MSDQQMNGQVAEEWNDEIVAVDPNQLYWGLSSLSLLAYGAYAWSWYPRAVAFNRFDFPDSTDGFDNMLSSEFMTQEWALGTKEIRAWTWSSYFLMGMYGFSSFAWLLNLGFGGNGGRTHSLFFQTTQLWQVAPLVAAWHAMKVQRSYIANGDQFDNLTNDETLEYLYDPDETDESVPTYFDRETFITRLFTFYLLAGINLAVNTYTVANIKADYLVQKAHFDAMKAAEAEEEEAEEEEPAEERPAREEEEQFF